MMLVAALALGSGVCLLMVAPVFLMLSFADQRQVRTLRRIAPSAINSWTRGRVAGEGVTEYGPAGRQTGPVSGEDCVWYRVTLTREPKPEPWWAGDEDRPNYEVLLDVATPGWPALADRTGRVPVDPRMLDDPVRVGPAPSATTTIVHRRSARTSLPPIVPSEVVVDLRKNETLTLTEFRVPRGSAVFALGRMTAEGLRPSRFGLTVFTTRGRADLLAIRRDDIGIGRKMFLGFALTGLIVAAGSAALLALAI